MSYAHTLSEQWAFVQNIAVTDSATELVPTPGTGRTLMVQVLHITITTAAAQTFDLEDDSSSPVEVFKAPASLAVGTYVVDAGPLGRALGQNTGLQFDPAAAGVGATLSGFGYVREDTIP